MNARSLAAVGLLVVGLGALAWWTVPRATTPPSGPAEPRRPNVLLVVWDTTRADRMSVYGHSVATTPGLERFAEQARVYEQAISPATWTIPSHASLFTGLPAATHGADAGWKWLDGHHVTLAEHLGSHGYRTFAFSANPYVATHTNLLQGFDTGRLAWMADRDATRAAGQAKLIREDRSTEISPGFAGEHGEIAWKNAPHKEAADIANAHLLDWVGSQDERPWFAFLNLMEAHSPRIPAMASRRAVMDEDRIALGLATEATVWTQVSAIVGRHTYTREEQLALRGVYDASLLELDRAFERLMTALDDRGVLDDTVVILTSDHGESLGEHGLYEHRWGLWQTLVHVPLIVRYPARLPPGRVPEPVSTTSVFSTVLELVELPPPPGRPPPRSLVRAPRGAVLTQLLDPFAAKLRPFVRTWPDLDPSPWLRTYDGIVRGPLKGILASDGSFELYDLHADPAETVDLAATHPDAASVREELERWVRVVPKADPSKRRPADLRRGKAQPQGEEAELLEVLGYSEEDP